MPSWDAITDDAALSAIPATLLALTAPEHPPAIVVAGVEIVGSPRVFPTATTAPAPHFPGLRGLLVVVSRPSQGPTSSVAGGSLY
jgi:hypothetical protein